MRPDRTPDAKGPSPKRPGPKRFYERAEAAPDGGAYAVKLDGRTARSPGRRALAAPRALAEAMAAEWAGQGDTLDMHAMPLTRLHGRRLDADEAARAGWAQTARAYAGTDLLCYRGDEPALAARQAEVWQPYLDRVGGRLGGRFAVTEGIVAVAQDEALLDAVRSHAESLADPARYALALLTEITGSAVLALAVLTGDDPGEAFAASRLDERYQEERWGQDAEAREREAALARSFADVVRYWRLSEG